MAQESMNLYLPPDSQASLPETQVDEGPSPIPADDQRDAQRLVRHNAVIDSQTSDREMSFDEVVAMDRPVVEHKQMQVEDSVVPETAAERHLHKRRGQKRKPAESATDLHISEQRQMLDALKKEEETLRPGLVSNLNRIQAEHGRLQTQHGQLQDEIHSAMNIPGTQASQETVVDEDLVADKARQMTVIGKRLRRLEKENDDLDERLQNLLWGSGYAKIVFDRQNETKHVAMDVFTNVHHDVRRFLGEANGRTEDLDRCVKLLRGRRQVNDSLRDAIQAERSLNEAAIKAMRGVQLALHPLIPFLSGEQQKQLVKDKNETFLVAFEEAGRRNADTESDHD
jgi:hypothetical protein